MAIIEETATAIALVREERSSIRPSSPVWMHTLVSDNLYPVRHAVQIPFFSSLSYWPHSTQFTSVHLYTIKLNSQSCSAEF